MHPCRPTDNRGHCSYHAHTMRVRLPQSLPQSLHLRLWLVIALASLPVFLLAFVDYHERRQEAVRSLQNEVQAMLRAAQRGQEGAQKSMLQTFQIMARADNLQSLDPADCSGLARRMLLTMQDFTNLGAVLPDGRIFCSALNIHPTGEMPSVADRPWFQRAVVEQGLGAAQFVAGGRLSGLPVMVFGYPVRRSDGSLKAVLFASLPIPWFDTLIERLELPLGWNTFLLDQEGKVLSYHPSSDRPLPAHGSATRQAFWSALQHQQHSLELNGLDGHRRMYGIAPLHFSHTPILLAMGAPMERTIDHIDQGFWLRIALLTVIALASALAARYSIHNLIEAWVRRISTTLQYLAAGHLERRITQYSPVDEFNTLEHGINRMADDLQQRSLEQLRLSAAVQQSPVALLITDTEARIQYANAAFLRTHGCTLAQVLGREPSWLNPSNIASDTYQAIWTALRTGRLWQGEFSHQRSNGSHYLERCTVSPVVDERAQVTHFVISMQDITQQRQSEALIEHLAYYDELTGLANRALLQARMAEHLRAAHSAQTEPLCALLLLDVDRFKQVNDTLGHAAGDDLLQQMAQRLQHCAPEGALVARWGSNTFALFAPGLGQEAAQGLAQSALHSLRQPYLVADGQRLYVTTSGGMALCGSCDISAGPGTLLKHAEVALYRAKDTHETAILLFDAAMQAQVQENATLEMGLRQALQTQAFELHYQVQVNAQGTVVGAEALIRWPHGPHGQPVSPVVFIALAEETGLIIPLGLWVLHTACAQLARWQERPETRHLTLSINVSARQFHQNDFVAQVRQALRLSGIDPSRLKLELTESVILGGVEATVAHMLELRALGLRFALDDFGTGYSSLSYLQRLPFDQLKIDQSFTRAMLVDPASSAIVRAILVMSEALGLEVIAEGVESAEHHEFLVRHACHGCQGYWFGRPMPIERWEATHLPSASIT